MPAGGALRQPLLPDHENGNGNEGAGPHVAIGVGKVEDERPPAARPVAAAEGVVPILLETRDLNYYLGGDKGQEKRILKDVNLCFSSGVLTAVMGCVRVCAS